jgi:hypothetical protein
MVDMALSSKFPLVAPPHVTPLPVTRLPVTPLHVTRFPITRLPVMAGLDPAIWTSGIVRRQMARSSRAMTI